MVPTEWILLNYFDESTKNEVIMETKVLRIQKSFAMQNKKDENLKMCIKVINNVYFFWTKAAILLIKY